jgi:flagellar motor component MotA
VKINYCSKAINMSRRYTKADLEEIVYKQLDNLNAMHDLLRIMKVQNDLIQNINQTLREEIGQFKEQQVMYPTRRKSKS